MSSKAKATTTSARTKPPTSSESAATRRTTASTSTHAPAASTKKASSAAHSTSAATNSAPVKKSHHPPAAATTTPPPASESNPIIPSESRGPDHQVVHVNPVALIDAATNTDNDTSLPSAAPIDSPELVALRAELASVKDALDSKDIEVLTLQNQLAELEALSESRNSSFASELNTQTVYSKMEAENAALQKQIASLRKEREEDALFVKAEVDKAAKARDAAIAVIQDAHAAETASLKATVAAQTAQIESVLHEVSTLKESNLAKDFELARSARDYLALQQSAATAIRVEDAKGEELEFARDAVEQGRAHIHLLEDAVSDLQAKLAAAGREFAAISTERDALLIQVDSGNEAILKVEVLTKSIESLKNSFENEKSVAISTAIGELEAENAKLTQELDTLRIKHDQELQFSELLKQSGVDSEKNAVEITELNNRIKELELVLEDVQEQRKAIADKLDGAKATIESQATQLSDLSSKLAAFEAEKEELVKTNVALQAGKDSAVASIASIESEKAELNAKLQKLLEEHEISTATVESLQKSIEITSSTGVQAVESEAIASLEAQLAALTNRNMELEQSFALTSTDLIAAQGELEFAQGQSYAHVDQIGQLNARIAALEAELDSARESLAQLAETHTNLVETHNTAAAAETSSAFANEAELSALRRDRDAAIAEVASIKVVLDDSLKRLVQLQEAHDEAKEQFANASGRVEILEQNLKDVGVLLADQERKVADLTSQLSSLLGNSAVELLGKKKAAVEELGLSDREKLDAYGKLVAELEIQLVSAEYRYQKPKVSPKSPILHVGQLKVVNAEE
ncbi:hypothetical protein HDU83_008628 [Entophlyctis luteolus]|nr:hypothetical protein HDU82_004241 [Entophlyctis luteolus]KAJ3357121.1 hypothetical protein HDU83_008628 [Entophlyctis luteolus]KAJ3392006.1 hypothetical protein HDU84_004934 [Entophlyctis sp. JEL0112]